MRSVEKTSVLLPLERRFAADLDAKLADLQTEDHTNDSSEKRKSPLHQGEAGSMEKPKNMAKLFVS